MPLLLAEAGEIKPSLIHGDLWIGNTGATKDEVCVYDPAACFAHSEVRKTAVPMYSYLKNAPFQPLLRSSPPKPQFELAIMQMFGGYTPPFWSSYHSVLPKTPGFDDRAKLYAFYHYLNQLNLFGDKEVKRQCDEVRGRA